MYRTHTVATNRLMPAIHGAFYFVLIARLFSVLTAVKLLQYLGGLNSSFKEILDNIQ